MATYSGIIKCTICKKEENVMFGNSKYFQKDKQKKIGFRSQCKDCRSIISKNWKDKKLLENANYNASRRMVQRYGITIDEYDEMLKLQNGKCAICGTNKLAKGKSRFAIDHCHYTGKVRGLLCTNCNSGIGKLKDDKDLIMNAYIYLVNNGGIN